LQRKSFLYPTKTLKNVIEETTYQNIKLPTDETEITRLIKCTYEYTLKHLKDKRNIDGLSNFDYLILEKMSTTNGKNFGELKEIALKVRNLEANPALGQFSDFPSLHLKAKTIVQNELQTRMKDPKVQISYLVELAVNKYKDQLQNDYIFAVDSVGAKKAEYFSSCLLELQLLQTEPIVNEKIFKSSLLFSLESGMPINLVHIKSLRYTYPKQGGLEIISNTKQARSIGLSGEKRVYPDEIGIFERLKSIRQLLSHYGIKSSLTVLAADRDLEYLFPDNNPLIDSQTKDRARRQANDYVIYLKKQNKDIETVDSLTGFLERTGKKDEYEKICSEAIKEAKNGGGRLVSEKNLEMRVNHQFTHYVEMFGRKYNRDLARYTASHQIANLLALSAVFDSFERPPVVVIDGRGFETRLIGAYRPQSRSIFLTKLKDPVRVIQ